MRQLKAKTTMLFMKMWSNKNTCNKSVTGKHLKSCAWSCHFFKFVKKFKGGIKYFHFSYTFLLIYIYNKYKIYNNKLKINHNKRQILFRQTRSVSAMTVQSWLHIPNFHYYFAFLLFRLKGLVCFFFFFFFLSTPSSICTGPFILKFDLSVSFCLTRIQSSN